MFEINQQTINNEIELTGIGLHNGQKVNLVIKPLEVDSGIIFKRIDINQDNIINASFKNVVEPILCTKIKNKKI